METIKYYYKFDNFHGDGLLVSTDEIKWEDNQKSFIGEFEVSFDEKWENSNIVVLVAAYPGGEKVWIFGPYDDTEATYVRDLLNHENIRYSHPDLRKVRDELEDIDCDDFVFPVIVNWSRVTMHE